MRAVLYLAIASTAAFVSALAAAAEIHVPADYPTIQSAIDASVDGDVVIVSPGTYVESINFLGKAVILRSIDPSDPQVVASTVIDGNSIGRCVTFDKHETSSTVLAGFTIMIRRSYPGAGIYCLESSPLITDVVILGDPEKEDGLSYGGAALYALGTNLVAMRLLVIGNGISASPTHRSPSHITLVDSAVVSTWAISMSVRGPAVLVGDSFSSTDGYWALEIVVGPSVVAKCQIQSAYMWGGSGVLSGCTITGNPLTRYWDSASLKDSDVVLSNVMIAGNYSRGIHCKGASHARLDCVTLTGNRMGGVLLVDTSSLSISNSIIYGNTFPLAHEIFMGQSRDIVSMAGNRTITVDHRCLSNDDSSFSFGSGTEVIWQDGNVRADPLFVNPGGWDLNGTPLNNYDDTFILGDYHLLPGSPCIDAATNDVDNPDTPEIETLPATDIAGVPRVIDGNLDGSAIVDIGAYEHLPGDVNYDGRVNVLDLILVRNSMGRDPASSIQARKADVNADGAVNVEDLLLVRTRLGK